MNEVMRKLLQLEAFELRTLLIQYRQEHGQWPKTVDRLSNEVEYNTPDAIRHAGWTFEISAAEGPTGYWAIKVTHKSGVSRTFCVDIP